MALSARDLRKTYRGGIEALRGLTFEVEQGRICGLIGPNGAGKTTTIAIMAGLVRASAGHVAVFGRDLHEHRAGARHVVGIAFDDHPFVPVFSAVRNLRSLARFSPNPPPEARVDEVLTLVGLRERARSRVGSFSRGMRQRLGIAAALLHDPPILILDEPFSGLDPPGVRDLKEIVTHLRDRGKTILFSSHQLTDVEEICEQIVIIRDGAAVFEGDTRALTHDEGVLVVSPSLEDALSVLLDGGVRAQVRGEHLIATDVPADRVNALLVSAGVPVTELRPVRASLQDRFFELMRPDHE